MRKYAIENIKINACKLFNLVKAEVGRFLARLCLTSNTSGVIMWEMVRIVVVRKVNSCNS